MLGGAVLSVIQAMVKMFKDGGRFHLVLHLQNAHTVMS